MFASSWLRQLQHRWYGRRGFHHVPLGRVRPCLEALEDRTLLSGGLPYATASNSSQLAADITYANSNPGSYTVALGNTIQLTSVDNTTNGANGLPVIAAGDQLTIVGNGYTIERSTAANTPAFRLFDVASGASLTLQNLTLQGGLAQGTDIAAEGGAVYSSGDLTLSSIIVTSNEALGNNGGNGGNYANGGNGGSASGGGLYVAGGSATLTNDTLRDNNAQGGGGGLGGGGGGGNGGNGGNGMAGAVYVATGALTLTNNTLSDNHAQGGNGGGGAASGAGGNAGNGMGGAVYVATGALTLTNNTLSDNNAQGGNGGGGGVSYNVPGLGGGMGGNATGGGLDVASGNVTLANDTLSDNNARGGNGGVGGTAYVSSGGYGGGGGRGGNASGGGLYTAASSVTLTNDTLGGNTAHGGAGGRGGFAKDPSSLGILGTSGGDGGNGGDATGGGLYILNSSATTTLANTLIAENRATASQGGTGESGGKSGSAGGASDPDVSATVASSDHDLIGEASGFTATTSIGDILNPSFVGLGALANNGGPTQTMALLPGSPAIDAGDSSLPSLPSTDQRGYPRLVGNAIDIGAYQAQGFKLAVSGGNNQNTLVNTGFAEALIVTVTAVDGVDPVADGQVTFTTPTSGASAALSPANPVSIAANGTATVNATANGTPGQYDVTADTAGVATPVAFALTNNQATPIVPTPSVPSNAVYTGQPQGATVGNVSGVNNADLGAPTLTYYDGTYTLATLPNSGGSTTPPTNAGNYTVVASYAGSTDYTSASSLATYTISPAPIRYTIGNDTQAYGQPANLAADLPATLNTGVNGETLDLTYSSSGDTSSATPGTYPITAVVSDGSGLTSNYQVQLTNGTLTVLGSGVNAVGSTLWIVGTSGNDNVQIKPAGASNTGSTGLQVMATLSGDRTSTTFNQAFTAINIVGYGGNDNINVANSLTINTTVKASNGNDKVILGDGNNSVTLGDGNDTVQAGNGNNTVRLGDGNDNVQVGDGNNVVVTGSGHDSIEAGNGNNLIAAGLGQHTVLVGNGSNILIDGSVQLAQSGDSLRKVLDDWMANGAQTANVDGIRARLLVTDNSSHANTLRAGSGLDWFWATYAKDALNAKPTDLRN